MEAGGGSLSTFKNGCRLLLCPELWCPESPRLLEAEQPGRIPRADGGFLPKLLCCWGLGGAVVRVPRWEGGAVLSMVINVGPWAGSRVSPSLIQWWL